MARRFNNGFGYKHSTYFYSAINKYGWDNFEHIILEENLSEEGKLRKQQIGSEHRGLKHSNETKKKMSEAHKGKKPHEWTEEARKNLSKSLKEKKVNVGLHWFNDGQKNIKALVCPEGFVPWMLLHRRAV